MWIDFIRTLFYEGWMGINIWYIMIAVVFCGLIYSNWSYLKMAFSPRSWRRKFMVEFADGIKGEIDLPPMSEDMDREDLRNINKAINDGINMYCEKTDTENPLDRIGK